MGTIIVVNSDGWILTAAHILEPVISWQQNSVAADRYLRAKREVEGTKGLSPGQKRHRLKTIPYDERWITDLVLNIGAPALQIQAQLDREADLALFQLRDIAPLAITNYPVFGNPKTPISPGTSLCRLGYPFHQIAGVTFDEAKKKFDVPPIPPLAIFPNDGIYTRDQIAIHQPSGRRVHNLETSSPGLKGQSGGPILDCSGNVWAIQSKTMSLPLGFTPKVREGGREIVEHQFMHVGIGAHVSHIRQFLDHHNVAYATAE